MKKLLTILLIAFSLFAKAQIYVSPTGSLNIYSHARIDTINNEGTINIYNSSDFSFKRFAGVGKIITYYNFDAKKRYLIGTPFQETTAKIFNLEHSKMQNNFWQYAAGWQIIQDTNLVLQPGKGYLSASNIYKNVQLTGTPNDTVTYTFAPGLNLFSNPFLNRLDSTIFAVSLQKKTPGEMVHGKGFFINNTTAGNVDITLTEAQTVELEPNLEITDSAIVLNGLWNIQDTARGFLPPRSVADSFKNMAKGIMFIDTTMVYSHSWIINGTDTVLSRIDTIPDSRMSVYSGINEYRPNEPGGLGIDTIVTDFNFYRNPPPKFDYNLRQKQRYFSNVSKTDTIIIDFAAKGGRAVSVWKINPDGTQTMVKASQMKWVTGEEIYPYRRHIVVESDEPINVVIEDF